MRINKKVAKAITYNEKIKYNFRYLTTNIGEVRGNSWEGLNVMIRKIK